MTQRAQAPVDDLEDLSWIPRTHLVVEENSRKLSFDLDGAPWHVCSPPQQNECKKLAQWKKPIHKRSQSTQIYYRKWPEQGTLETGKRLVVALGIEWCRPRQWFLRGMRFVLGENKCLRVRSWWGSCMVLESYFYEAAFLGWIRQAFGPWEVSKKSVPSAVFVN